LTARRGSCGAAQKILAMSCKGNGQSDGVRSKPSSQQLLQITCYCCIWCIICSRYDRCAAAVAAVPQQRHNNQYYFQSVRKEQLTCLLLPVLCPCRRSSAQLPPWSCCLLCCCLAGPGQPHISGLSAIALVAVTIAVMFSSMLPRPLTSSSTTSITAAAAGDPDASSCTPHLLWHWARRASFLRAAL
jgi:hypothetical protein